MSKARETFRKTFLDTFHHCSVPGKSKRPYRWCIFNQRSDKSNKCLN